MAALTFGGNTLAWWPNDILTEETVLGMFGVSRWFLKSISDGQFSIRDVSIFGHFRLPDNRYLHAYSASQLPISRNR